MSLQPSPFLPLPVAHRPSADAEHDALVDTLSFEPVLHFQTRFGPGFAIDIDGRRRAPLYVFAGRSCWFRMHDGGAPIQVEHGDVLFLPHAGAHRIFDTPGVPPLPFASLVTRKIERKGQTYAVDMDEGADGGDATVVSGSFFWTEAFETAPLIARLPDVIHLRHRNTALPWLPPMADLVRWLSDIRRGGRGVGMTETVNTLVRHIVLAHLQCRGAHQPASGSASAAPRRDARLHAAFHAIHTRPEAPWTLESLAGLCHMSRTTFATRFQQQARLPPMSYLANWRVQLAARLLREQRLSLDEVASRVGYSTGAILARAYKRVLGASPRCNERELTNVRR